MARISTSTSSLGGLTTAKGPSVGSGGGGGHPPHPSLAAAVLLAKLPAEPGVTQASVEAEEVAIVLVTLYPVVVEHVVLQVWVEAVAVQSTLQSLTTWLLVQELVDPELLSDVEDADPEVAESASEDFLSLSSSLSFLGFSLLSSLPPSLPFGLLSQSPDILIPKTFIQGR